MQLFSWMRWTLLVPTSGMRERASRECVHCAARRWRMTRTEAAAQSRLDVHGKDIGPFVIAAGQPDFAAFFGAANSQACALRCLRLRQRTLH